MRTLLLLAALCMSAAVHAQPQGANMQGDAMGGIQDGAKTDEQKKGASANETSSDREEGRGARGAIR